MASVSISHMVIFIASLVIAAGVVGTMTTGVDRVNEALEDNSIDASEQLRTDVTVISDAGGTVYDSGNDTISLLVKNTGTQPLPPDGTNLDVIVNGQFVDPANVDATVLTGTGDTWNRNDVLRLEINGQGLSTGDHRVKLTINGEEAVFRFRYTG